MLYRGRNNRRTRNVQYRMKRFSCKAAALVVVLATVGGALSLFPGHALAAMGAWSTVGSPIPADPNQGPVILAADNNGVPYVAYYDDDAEATYVKKFNGSDWVAVGDEAAGFFPSSMAFAPDNTLYLSYPEGNGKAHVAKYSGGSWMPVGSDVSSGHGWASSLAIASDGTPYMAYTDASQSDKVSVKKYQGANWTLVGDASFSPANSAFVFMRFMPDGTPIVAYDHSNGGDIQVRRYDSDSNTWQLVGASDFTEDAASSPSFAIASDGTPYISYIDAANDDGVTVKKFSGSSWVNVGATFGGDVLYDSLTLVDDKPVVVYSGLGHGGSLSARIFNGTSWQYYNSAFFTGSGAYFLMMASAASTGTLYTTFFDDDDNIIVMSYTQPLASATFPNAVNGKAISLSTPVLTRITCSTGIAPDPNHPDAGYSYPLGFASFCFFGPSANNQVTLVFVTDLKPDEVTARKYNSVTHTYATVPGATIAETTYGGQHALQLTYTITDNGPLDEDPAVGSIADPVGLAMAMVGTDGDAIPEVPNTGLAPTSMLSYGILPIVGIMLLIGTAVTARHARQ